MLFFYKLFYRMEKKGLKMNLLWSFFLLTATVTAQDLNFNCPPDWIANENTCYKFVYSPKLPYEKARKACADTFSSLVSVENGIEHSFIETYLTNNDYFRNKWYTRGIQDFSDSNKWFWDGDPDTIPYNQQYWITRDTSGVIIVYSFNGVKYGWSKASKNEENSYICEIPRSLAYRLTMEQRTFEYGVSFNNLTNIEKGPIFLEQPQSLVVVSRTPTAELECRAICNPTCEYSWYRGLNLNEYVIPASDRRYTMTNGKLMIQNPTEGLDASDYQCKVSNKMGSILSNPVKLSFGALGEFSNVQDAPTYAKAYEGAAIHCSQIKVDPAATYMWLRGNPPREMIAETIPYTFMSANGRLYFSEVTEEDALEYYCQVSLTSLTTSALGTSQAPSRTSRPIKMIVSQQAPKSNWGPDIQDDFIYVSPERPLKGYNVRMECFAYGSAINYEATWSYKWTRPGSEIPSTAKFSDFNRVLTISNAQPEDEGNYVCTVARGTTASHSRNLYLRLYSVPYYLVPLRAQHVDLGSALTWRCEAAGYPYPIYEWYKDGRKVENVQGEINVDGHSLTIYNLQLKHSGMYQCSAANYLGTSMSEAQLRVLAFKPSFSKKPLPEEIYGAVRGNITIQCRPEAAPAPIIEWFQGQSKLTPSEKYKIQPNGDLTITGLTTGDGGYFRCKATNDYGTSESSVRIVIKGDVTIPVGPVLRTTAVVNETAFIRCEASYDPVLDLVYVWKKNGHVIDLEKDFYYEQSSRPGYSGLTIKLVQERHEGMYECIAKTPVNEAVASGLFVVNGPPDAPAGVSADSTTTTSLRVNWYAPKFNGLPIEYYAVQQRVEVENGDMSEWYYIDNDEDGKVFEIDVKPQGDVMYNPDRRSYQVQNLKPGNIYQFRVAAKNGYTGMSPFSYPSGKTKTMEAAPIVTTSQIYGGNGSVGDLHIIWKEMPYEDRGAHDHGGYIVYWRLYEEGNNDRIWNRHIIPNWKTTFFVELVGIDNYYLQYEVKVQGYNNYGRGPNATEIVYSSEGMPTAAPANVLADGYNSTAMEVTWDSVEDTREVMKGRLYGYQINYYADEDVEPVYKQYIRYPGQMDSAIVIGLWADSNFWFQIQVYNTAGLGPASDLYKQESLHLAARLYPLEVHVFSHSASSVLVTWRGILIEFDEATITNYRLYLWPSNEHFRTAKEIDTEGLVNSFVLTELEKSIIYALRIAAMSDGGEGKKSPTIYFTLTGGANVAIDQTLTEFRAGSTTSFISIIVLIGSLFISVVTWL